MSFEFFGRTFHFLSDGTQRGKAADMLKEYVFKPQVFVILVLLVVYFLLRCYARVSKKEKLRALLRRISPWVYLVIILGVTLFNRSETVREIRLTPDSWLASGGRVHESAILGFAFNLVLYIPFGYLLYKYLNCPKRVLSAVSLVLLSSILIETLQFIFARGVLAIDDFFANSIGGLLGIGFAFLISKFKTRKRMRESVE